MTSEIKGTPAAMSRPTHPHAARRSATGPAAAAAGSPDETTPVTKPVEEPFAATAVDHSRRHVQQSLHQLDRLLRHEIKERMKSSDLDPGSVRSLKDLMKDFRVDLQDAFHAAGRGGDFDRSLILPGIGEAVTALTEALRALRGGEDEVAEVPDVVETPETVPAPDPIERSDFGETVFVEPGGLLEVVA